jgi:hypothetical protein
MFGHYKETEYTGFGDCAVLFHDNDVNFLEWTCRFGYNAHPTLFRSLLIAPFGETLAQMIDSPMPSDAFYEKFRKGFGASIRMYCDHTKLGWPLYVSKDVAKMFYHFEAYQDETCLDPEQDYRLAGFGNDVGIICAHGWTVQDAGKKALENALKINFPICAYREDLDEANYPSSPIKRYEAIRSMGLL